MKTVALIYDADALHGDAASQDVVEQLDAIEAALHTLGYASTRIGVDLDLRRFKERLFSSPPDLAFNLVESLDHSDRLQSVVAMVLEDWGIPFTGCGSMAMAASNHKIESKRRLDAAGIPTAPCLWLDRHGKLQTLPNDHPSGVPADWILKTVESHASLFMDDSSVIRQATPEQTAQRLHAATQRHNQPFFAERFIDGREFNLSVIESPGGMLTVLPPAEICFDNLPADKPRIVGYAAKWEEESEEYRETPRRFIPEDEEKPLKETLSEVSKEVWRVLGLSGYARVDFRIDVSGNPYVLEANSNPCLSPDAGFAAAANRAGLEYHDLVRRIMEVAIRAYSDRL